MSINFVHDVTHLIALPPPSARNVELFWMKAEKAYLDKLIWALEYRDRETVLRAITILGMLGSEAEAAVPALQEVFKKGTRDPYIQANAAMALMKINAKKARGFLSSYLNHPNIIVRRAVEKELDKSRDKMFLLQAIMPELTLLAGTVSLGRREAPTGCWQCFDGYLRGL